MKRPAIATWVILSLVFAFGGIVSAGSTGSLAAAATRTTLSDAASGFVYIINGDDLVITGYFGASADAVIPEKIDSHTVTAINIQPDLWGEISDAIFMMKTITIPRTVTEIDCQTFNFTQELQEITVDLSNPVFSSLDGVLYDHDRTAILFIPPAWQNGSFTIPGTVSKINSIFYPSRYIFDFTELQDIHVDPSSPYFTSQDGVLYSKDMTSLIYYMRNKTDSTFTIPDGVARIGQRAFSNGYNLEKVILPESLTAIEDYAFEFCEKMTEIRLPGQLSTIGEGIFLNCSVLRTITIDPQNQYFTEQEGALYDKPMTRLIIYQSMQESSEFKLPDSVLEIADGAFAGCANLKKIVLGDQVTRIGENAFAGCWGLEELNLPNQITELPANCLDYCIMLRSITLPDKLQKIGDYALANCENLTEINLPGSITEIGIEAFSRCSNLTAVILPEQLTDLAQGLFSGCGALEHVKLPDALRSIGASAFSSCTSLGSIALPDSITSIGENAFTQCIGLQEMTLPAGLTSLSSRLFIGCNELQRITIQGNVRQIGSYVFNGCESLTSLSLPASLELIAGDAFQGLIHLQSIDVQDGNLIYASQEGVLYDKDMSSVLVYPQAKKEPVYTMPDSVSQIGLNAFSQCARLKKIILSQSLTEIGVAAFKECRSIEEIVLPDSLTRISENAFASCSGLTSMNIPASVTSIGEGAFDNCRQLESVFFYGNAPVLDGQPFWQCGSGFSFYYLYGNTGFKNLGYPAQFFEKDKMMVRFEDWNGSNLKTVFVSYGKAARAPVSPTREDYIFVGWDKFFDQVINNITVTAQYKVKPPPKPSFRGPALIVAGVALIILISAAVLIFRNRKHHGDV